LPSTASSEPSTSNPQQPSQTNFFRPIMINDQQHINQQLQKSRQFCQNNLNQNQFLEQQQPHDRFVYSNLEALNVAGYSGSMAMISGGSQQQHPQQPQQCHQMVVKYKYSLNSFFCNRIVHFLCSQ